MSHIDLLLPVFG